MNINMVAVYTRNEEALSVVSVITPRSCSLLVAPQAGLVTRLGASFLPDQESGVRRRRRRSAGQCSTS